MTHSSALIAFEGSRRLRRYLCKDGWRCIRLGSRPQGRGQFGLESRPNGFGVRLDKPHCRYDVASVTECGANPMKIQSLLIASLLLTGTALAEPVPRVGLCPSHYYSQGNYCIPWKDNIAIKYDIQTLLLCRISSFWKMEERDHTFHTMLERL